MIVKDLDTFPPLPDALAKAGRAAEEQMAFYLRRAFAADTRTRVLNSVRLVKEGDATQIDHLVLLPWGILVVESKSVTSRVRINDYGEWTRWFNGRAQGMPSPVLQAQRQAEFLMAYLADYTADLRDRRLFRRRDFAHVPYSVLVAISDSGIVERPRHLRLDEVCKADQVVDRIRGLVGDARMPAGEFSLDELERISQFLVDHHKPQAAAVPPRAFHSHATGEAPSASAQAANPLRVPPKRTPRCRHCTGTDVIVLSGRYGYYYKCQQCQGNTRINTTCPRCGSSGAIHKKGWQYTFDCASCGLSTVFFPVDDRQLVALQHTR